MSADLDIDVVATIHVRVGCGARAAWIFIVSSAGDILRDNVDASHLIQKIDHQSEVVHACVVAWRVCMEVAWIALCLKPRVQCRGAVFE
jgi:hypothetical protein